MKLKEKNKKKGDIKMKQKTYVVLVLDQSGSMASIRKQAVDGYNEQIQQMKLNSKDQDIFCSLVTFNGDIYEHQWLESADKLNEASEADYPTNGSTAFRDAIGYTINRLQESTDPSEENIGYLIVVISDGEENASKHISPSALRESIQSCQKTGKWTFSYMGCNKAYVEQVSRETSIPVSNMAVWDTKNVVKAAKGLHMNAAKVGGYYKARAGGQSATNKLYSDVEYCMADFTGDDADLNAIKSIMPVNDLSKSAAGAWTSQNENVFHSNNVSPFSNTNKPVKWTC